MLKSLREVFRFCINMFPARCICGLLKKKPRILVTHQLQYLKAADQILVLKEVCAFFPLFSASASCCKQLSFHASNEHVQVQ